MLSIPLASYFRAEHLTVHPSIPLASYVCVVHSLSELFSCRAFNSPSFGQLFSCLPYNSPSVHPLASYCRAIHPLGELFSCGPFNSPAFGELFCADYLLSPSFYPFPGDFVTNVKQISSQSDLTSMSSFAGPSYLTVRSSL